jgi:hypothetical protein
VAPRDISLADSHVLELRTGLRTNSLSGLHGAFPSNGLSIKYVYAETWIISHIPNYVVGRVDDLQGAVAMKDTPGLP